MIRFFLGQAPLVPSVRTSDLARPDCLAEALARVAFRSGALVVNSSQDGGAKDKRIVP